MFTESKDTAKSFITFVMGARKIDSPMGYMRCELVVSVSSDFESDLKMEVIIAGELVRLSKIPFRE